MHNSSDEQREKLFERAAILRGLSSGIREAERTAAMSERPVVNADESGTVVTSARRYWRVPAAVLLAVFAGSWFVWGPLGGVFYVGGLFNSQLVFMLVPFLFLLLLAAVICVPCLTIRTIARWSRLDAWGKWWRVSATIVALAFVSSFFLGFADSMPSPADMFARGFLGYADRRADIGSILNWLDSLDPNDYREPGADRIERILTDSEQPPAIAHLHPKMAKLLFDDSGRLTVCLLWGSGMIGHWGIMVGRKNMPMPPSDSAEEWVPLQPGAYVWSGH